MVYNRSDFMMKKLLLNLLLLLTMAIGAVAQETLTVHDGSATSGYVPVYGFYADAYLKSEIIYPAEDLVDAIDGTISSMKFYASESSVSWGNANFQVFLKEVSESSISAFNGTGDATIVYEGSLSIAESEMEIVFTTPYHYTGSNLLVGIYNTAEGSYVTSTWNGESVNGASLQGYSYSSLNAVSGTQRNFIPKTTFTYTPGAAPTCPRPTELAKSNLTARTVDLAWTNGADETAWQICINGDEDNLVNVTTNPYQLTGLDPVTAYAVKVRANCGSEQSFWSNTVSFTTPPTCPVPTELICTGASSSSATLSWTVGASESEWNLQYKAAADADWTVENNVTSPYTITGLTEETNYLVQVQAVCDVDDLSDWSASTQVYTGYCQPAPNNRDGDGITAVSFGIGDDVVNNSDDNGLPEDAPYYGNYASMVGAVQAGVEATVNITFNTDEGYGYSYDYGTIIWIDLNNNLLFDANEVVYVGTSEEESPTTLVARFTLPASTPTGDYRMRIAAADSYYNDYVGSIAAAANADPCPSGGYTYAVVHDYTIRVNEAPACVPPANVAATNISNTSATITWSAGASEPAWQICVGDDEDNLIDVEATTYNLTELTAATPYSVKVRSNCDGSYSDWTTPISFTTALCPIENMCQISYELEDSYGDGWNGGAAINVIDVATSQVLATWTLTSGSSTNGTLSVCDGRDLRFEWHAGSFDSECSYTVTDVNGDEIFSGEGTLSTVNYNVSCSSCRKPSDLQVSNITTTSADLVWTPGDNEEEWQICLNGDEEHLITADANGYTLTGLDELTNYTVKVRANCGAEQSGWITATFTTLSSCPAPEDVEVSDIASYSANVSWTAEANADSYIVRYRPLTLVQLDDFENGFGNNWTIYTEGDAGAKWRIIDPTGGLEKEAHSGDSVASAWSWNSVEYHADNWLVTSQIEMGGVVSFWANTNGPNYPDHFEVLLSLTGNQIADFTTTLRPMGTVTGDWSEVTIDLSGYSGMGYVAIHHVDYDANYLLIDDFGIYSAGEWVEADPTTETSAVISNLAANTTYQYQVASVCGADDDNWSASGSFTTLVSCPAPTALTATNVTGHTATITWAAGAEETAWQVMVNDNDTEIVDVEDTPTYEMTGLDGQTPYSVKVRAYCDVDDQSAWVNVDFTTLVACPAPTALAATLTPGNGTIATLSWTENGTATAWTLEYGTAADFTGATSMEVTETPLVDLTGLTAETPYYARVKTVCGGVDGESVWSSVLNFTPTNAYSITLNDGTVTNSYVPVYGYYVDAYSRSQFIIPASDLTALQGATITKLTYYSSNASINWGNAQFDVRLAEVEDTAIESLATWDDMTLAYHGSLGISGNVMEVTFDTPYTYMGGNLMIGTNETVSGTYVSCSWYGVTANGASMGGYESTYGSTSFSQQNFLPKVTINYIPGAPRYTITATAGENGSIDPSGAVSVEEGVDKIFTITADNGYRILSVVVDNADATAALVEDNGVYTYTFFDVAADHTITATFVSESAVTYTITATAGDNGTITPSGAVSVEEGADQPFEITPNANYEIDVLTVDSNEITLTEEQREGFTYTFPNVIAGHTINVTFRLATSVEINNAASMAVYPNPNNGMFSIDFSNIEGEATYQLIDARGAVVETRDINVTNGETKMFNHTLTAGTYFVRIIAGDKVYVEQIVVE